MAVEAAFGCTMRTLIFPARYSSLTEIRQFVGAAARDGGMDDREVYAVQLAVDEACSNVIEHAYGGEGDEPIEITCSPHPDRLMIILRDYGRPFDPTAVPQPDIKADLSRRGVGGLGLYLIRKMMDEVTYEASSRAGNSLTMIKRKGGGG